MEQAIQLLKKIYSRFYRHMHKKNLHPDWENILKEDLSIVKDNLSKIENKKKVLIATSIGTHTGVTPIESLLAVALALRDTEVHILLCDKVLAACMACNIFEVFEREMAINGPQKCRCSLCFEEVYQMYKALGVEVRLYSDFLSEEDSVRAEEISKEIDIKDIKNYSLDGVSIGEHAFAGAIRFYASSALEREKYAEDIQRRYFKAALQTNYIISNLYDKYNFDCTTFHHGIYIPQGIIGEVSRKRNIRVVNWTMAYRKRSFIFSHNDTYHHTLMTEPVTDWENMNWGRKLDDDLMEYLNSRIDGVQDWITFFHKKPKKSLKDISKEIKIDFDKPTVGMLTNVVWDAQLHYPANAFQNMVEWLLYTMNYFINRKDLQLIIRVHPAERTGLLPSKQPVLEEIERYYKSLPGNITIISPKSQISTYEIMKNCNAVIIYGTKTGVELTSMGIPVIVAGEAWIRNKDITLDINSVEEYSELLDKLPLGNSMSKENILRARKYAYHFFFRRMIPLGCLEPTPGWPPYRIKINGIKDLMPDKDIGLDVICNGILNGSPFIYPAEKMETSD